MSKSKEKVNLTGEIIQTYDVIALKDGLNKQRFLLKAEDGAKHFVTAFGDEHIIQLAKFNLGSHVRVNAGKDVSEHNGKEYVNYYVNSITALSIIKGNVFFKRYIDFLNVNKIDHLLIYQDVEEVFNELKKVGITQIEFDTAIEYMVNKWRNILYFHLKTKEKLLYFITESLELSQINTSKDDS